MKTNVAQCSPGALRTIDQTSGSDTKYARNRCVSTAETVNEPSGRGVGMSAVRAVCRELGGSISVSSETGQGTSFHFQLPLQVAGISPGSGIRPVSHMPASQRGEPERAGSQG